LDFLETTYIGDPATLVKYGAIFEEYDVSPEPIGIFPETLEEAKPNILVGTPSPIFKWKKTTTMPMISLKSLFSTMTSQ
jgi:hypothetical protein